MTKPHMTLSNKRTYEKLPPPSLFSIHSKNKEGGINQYRIGSLSETTHLDLLSDGRTYLNHRAVTLNTTGVLVICIV